MKGLTKREMEIARIVQSTAGSYPHGPAERCSPEDEQILLDMNDRGLVVGWPCPQCGFWHPQLTALGLEAMSLQLAAEE